MVIASQSPGRITSNVYGALYFLSVKQKLLLKTWMSVDVAKRGTFISVGKLFEL